MVAVVEELVEHHQVVCVSPIRLEIWIFHVLPHGRLPQLVLEVVRYVEEDFFFLHSTLCVFVRAFLDFECVKLLVCKLKCKPDCGEVTPAKFA
jgi:hypothetical protein